MEITIIQPTKSSYQWENKLSFTDRAMITVLYSQGFAVFNIAKAFDVSVASIEWHLMKQGLYIKNRRPTQWNVYIPRRTIVISRSLAVPTTRNPLKPLPAHIQASYDKMEAEEREPHRPVRHYKRHPHLADHALTFTNVPFKAMYSFDLTQ